MERWTYAELDALLDKCLGALAQLKAAELNLITVVKKLEKMSHPGAHDALAGPDRTRPFGSQ